MFKRLLNIIKKEFMQIFRDPRMLFIIISGPIIQLLIFGYVATTDVKHITTAVYDLDNTKASREFVQSFKNSGYFDIEFRSDSIAEIKRLIDSGKTKISINIPKGFAKKIKAFDSAPLQVLIDGSDSNTATIATGYVSGIVWTNQAKIVQERFNKLGKDTELIGTLKNEIRVWYNPELKSVNFMVPGIIGSILMINIMILTAMAIVKEKEYGTMEQLIVTPIRPYELLIGKITPPAVIAYVDAILALVVGVFWFKVPFMGNIFLLLFLCLLFLIPSLGMGIFISLISRTQHQAMMTAFLFLFPSLLLGGFIFPIENMPGVIQALTYLIPLRYFLVILRAVFLKGVGLKHIWLDIWPLLVLGPAVLFVTVRRFRKKIT